MKMKRIACIALCAAMLLCLLPASAMAGGGDSEYLIERVSLVGINPAVVGETPDANCFLIGELNNTCYVEAYWQEDSSIGWMDMSDSDVFTAQGHYRCELCIRARDGYHFPMVVSGNRGEYGGDLFVNGVQEWGAWLDNGAIRIYLYDGAALQSGCYNVWVDGIRVSDKNRNDVLGELDGTAASVRYIPANADQLQSIVLTDALIEYGNDAIRCEGPTIVQLNGSNTLGSSDHVNSGVSFGIAACHRSAQGIETAGTVYLRGDGDLHIYDTIGGIYAIGIWMQSTGNVSIEDQGDSGIACLEATDYVELQSGNLNICSNASNCIDAADIILSGADFYAHTDSGECSALSENLIIRDFREYFIQADGSPWNGVTPLSSYKTVSTYSVISEINIINVDLPKPGTAPDHDGDVMSGGCYVCGVDWEAPPEGNFEYGKAYSANIRLETMTGCTFDKDFNLRVYVDGIPAKVVTRSPEELRVGVDFPVLDDGTGVYVDGVEVTEGHFDDVLGNGGRVKYEPAENGHAARLLLNDAELIYGDFMGCGIFSTEDLEIVLTGNNTLGTMEEPELYSLDFGIVSANGKVTLSGSGSLTIYDSVSGIVARVIESDIGGVLGVREYGDRARACCLRGFASVVLNGGSYWLRSIVSNAIKASYIEINDVNMNAMSEYSSALCGGVLVDVAEGSTVALGTDEQMHRWDGSSPLTEASRVYVGPVYEIADRCTCYQFEDVPAPGNWAHEPIDYVVSNGLMKGTGSGRFSPNNPTSRAMIVTLLYRVAGEPEVSGKMGFTDVAPGWYYDAVRWANANGIVNGYSDTRFGPNDPITREQFAAILSRFATLYDCYDGSTATLDPYPDTGELSKWAAAPMGWAVAHGLISGTSRSGVTYLDPKGKATRAQSAALLMRFLKNILGRP